MLLAPAAGLCSTLRGDADQNGKVDVFDLLLLLSYIGGGKTPDGVTRHIANIDKSAGDKLDVFDLLGLLKILSGNTAPEEIEWRPMISGPIETEPSAGDILTFLIDTFEGRASIPELHAIMNRDGFINKLDIVHQDSAKLQLRLPWTFSRAEIFLYNASDTLFACKVTSKQLDLGLARMEAKLRSALQNQLADNLRSSLSYELVRQMIIIRRDSLMQVVGYDTIPRLTAADSLKTAFEEFFAMCADREIFKPSDSFPNTWDIDVQHKGLKYFQSSDSACLHLAIGSGLLPADSTLLKRLISEQVTSFDEQERKEMLYYYFIEIPVTFRYNAWKICSISPLISMLQDREYWRSRIEKEKKKP